MKNIVLIIAAFSFVGCATILNDSLQKVNVSSSADSIKGSIDGVPFSGPGIVNVQRGRADKIIMIDTPSCQKQVLLASTVDFKFFINILSGGFFGSTTDFASDKMWKYQDQVIVPCK